jgi:hypothetical protein
MHLDLRKKTGDKFTADEFNQIISAINAKVEQEAGKALSDENFTAEEKLDFLAYLDNRVILLSPTIIFRLWNCRKNSLWVCRIDVSITIFYNLC